MPLGAKAWPAADGRGPVPPRPCEGTRGPQGPGPAPGGVSWLWPHTRQCRRWDPAGGGWSLARRLVPAPHIPALARTPRVPWCPQGQLLVPFLPTTSYPKRHVLTGVGLVTSALKREEKPTTPAIPGPRSSPSPTPGTASHSLSLFQKFTERPTASALRPLTPACAVGVPRPGFGRRSLTLTAPAGLRPEPWPARGRPAPRACCRLCQEGHPAPAAKPRARAAGATHSGSPSWTA